MSNNSHCVYLNTPVGGGGVRHTAFCIIWTNTKINLTFNHLNNQTFQHSNKFPNTNIQTTPQAPFNPHSLYILPNHQLHPKPS